MYYLGGVLHIIGLFWLSLETSDSSLSVYGKRPISVVFRRGGILFPSGPVPPSCPNGPTQVRAGLIIRLNTLPPSLSKTHGVVDPRAYRTFSAHRRAFAPKPLCLWRTMLLTLPISRSWSIGLFSIRGKLLW